jgi:hypothetical protein
VWVFLVVRSVRDLAIFGKVQELPGMGGEKIESCAYSGEDERLPTAELRNCVHIGTEYAPAIRSELNHIFPVFLHSFTHTHKHREASHE